MKKPIIFLFILFIFLPVFSARAETGRLIKGEGSNAVYYQAIDGKRYVFPNQKIYYSWYADFSGVVTISDDELAAIPIGGNVVYKPNSRLVKITSDPKVYWVDEFGVLRHVASEKTAQDFFGSRWAEKIDDLPDAFFANYTIGEPIDSGFLIQVDGDWRIDDNKKLTQKGASQAESELDQSKGKADEQPAPAEKMVDADQQPKSINLTVTTDDQDVILEWLVDGGNTNYGLAIVKSQEPNPVYPEDDYVIVANVSAIQYKWSDLPNGAAYYFRVCRLNSDGSCGVYSDEESVLIGAATKMPSITLKGYAENGVAKLSWDTEWLSPNYGFYLMRGFQVNPKYKVNPGVWIEKQEESFDWSGLSSGTHHFRVCRYTGAANDGCEYYSNDIELTIGE